MDHRRELFLTRLGLFVTLIASGFATVELASIVMDDLALARWWSLVMHVVFITIVAFLVYGGLVYQFARLNYLRRRRDYVAVPRQQLESTFVDDAPLLTVLVPSYKEGLSVVRTTLLSAAFQEYPTRRVVLLIDDPPQSDPGTLAATRNLVAEVRELLETQARLLTTEYEQHELRIALDEASRRTEGRQLASLNRQVAGWFTDLAADWGKRDHVDRLFIDAVLRARADFHTIRADELDRRGLPESGWKDAARCDFRRLAAVFSVELDSFERKQYVNLSHEPNKAMNLNSYLGLLGKRYRRQRTRDGVELREVPAGAPADLEVPDSEFVITLDADSLLRPDYALKLIFEMRSPGREDLAVIQTPYSSFPGAPGKLERIAGATTDIQYIIHQGFTGWDATYWVGANALLRMEALRDIAESDEERGYPITRFIQDRTVIEDTESSIDLVDRGWTLHNHPERLAFSATPPDFGSLLIQRRRWANGGLLILPKLLRFLARRPWHRRKVLQGFMRIHYLASIAAVNAGLLLVLSFPLTDAVETIWLPLTALPYFALYGRDLTQIGYRRGDLIRVYALNLVLIPVNLGGVLKSLQQAVTKRQIPFARTPKVGGRTAASPLYVGAEYLMLAHWSMAAAWDLSMGQWSHGLFAAVNAALLLYGITVFIGFRASVEDLSPIWKRERP
ncbi:MAG: glycosyl transferase, partial [Acidimicrobiia bacterium]|nr:glycosyl transferase [Acidimicrobiia bacterium]